MKRALMPIDLRNPDCVLDPELILRGVEEQLGQKIFTPASRLDPELIMRQIEQAVGQPIFSPAARLDPLLALRELAAVSGGGGTPPPDGGATYVAKAVHFDGATTLTCSSLTTSDSHFLAISFWGKCDDLSPSPTVWVVDPAGDYGTFLAFYGPGGGRVKVSDAGDNNELTIPIPDGAVVPSAWQHFLFALRTDLGVNGIAGYINDVNLNPDPPISWTANSPFLIALNGKSMMIGQDTYGDNFIGDIADLLIMPGINLFDGSNMAIAESTRRLFIDGVGRPVNPSVAIAALGTPAMYFSGDATTFATNQGSGGVFTVSSGALTNASTSPSDDSGYVARAVHFDGTTWLDCSALTAVDGNFFSMSFWFKGGADARGKNIFATDPNGSYTTYAQFDYSSDQINVELFDAAGAHQISLLAPLPLDGAWHHVLYTGESGQSAGSNSCVLFVDDVDVSSVATDNGPFALAFNGLEFAVFSDAYSSDNIIGDFADFWISTTSLLTGSTIAESDRRQFISAALKPVDPVNFPPGSVLFSGDATTFATNKGSGGAFTVSSGALSDASTSPS